MKVFENFGLSHTLLETIKKLGFDKPTEIQEQSIPYIMEGKDVIGESATGSGKTLAFGCGIVDKVFPKKGLQALILTPTRELAEQVKDSLKQLAKNKNLNIISIYGGVSIGNQIDMLPKSEVVIATPGRLLDHLQRKTINLSQVKLVVLDEADRMFDMGFIEDVEKIIRACPAKRQTLFFSATISPRIINLSRKYMVHPVKVFAKNMVDPTKLKQVYYQVLKNLKLSLLTHLLNNEKSGLVMVFCNTRINTDFVAKNLKANDIDAIPIHGGLSQNKRTYTMGLFNKEKVGVLVCTDVASRGLHVENVSHIYNYEIPKDPKDYVHRIGRTARAGHEGKVVNLLSDNDYGSFSNILSEYRMFKIERMKNIDFKRISPVKQGRERGRNERSSSNFSENRSRFGQKKRFSHKRR